MHEWRARLKKKKKKEKRRREEEEELVMSEKRYFVRVPVESREQLRVGTRPNETVSG